MRTRYEDYQNDEPITVTQRELFTDADGFPNEAAFRNFVDALTEEDDLCLACISIDLSASNEKKGYAYGTLILRKLFVQLKEHFYMFRISGDKFNLLLKRDEIAKAEKMLSSGNKELFTIYYGILDMPVTKDNIADLRRQGIDAMYSNKAIKTDKQLKEVRDDKIVGDKGNTPLELRETKTHKFDETMWYGTIEFEETDPEMRSIIAHVFPTEYKENFASVNTIVVLDDFVEYRVYSGNSIKFSFDRITFYLTSRFDDEGHLQIMCHKDRESKGKVDFKLDLHEGVCIPAAFGKRVGKNKEIFPIKANPSGSFDYVLWDNDDQTATLDKTGVVVIDNKDYMVHSNSKGINLVEQ